MPNREHAAAEQTVKGWGFEHVFTWRDGPYEPQSHTHTQRLLMIFFSHQECALPAASTRGKDNAFDSVGDAVDCVPACDGAGGVWCGGQGGCGGAPGA